jgi:hypothetical protein
MFGQGFDPCKPAALKVRLGNRRKGRVETRAEKPLESKTDTQQINSTNEDDYDRISAAAAGQARSNRSSRPRPMPGVDLAWLSSAGANG